MGVEELARGGALPVAETVRCRAVGALLRGVVAELANHSACLAPHPDGVASDGQLSVDPGQLSCAALWVP